MEEVHEDKIDINDLEEQKILDQDESQGDDNMTFDEFKEEFG